MAESAADKSAAAAAARGHSTKPMEVSEFLNKGIGAAALPRRAQVHRGRGGGERGGDAAYRRAQVNGARGSTTWGGGPGLEGRGSPVYVWVTKPHSYRPHTFFLQDRKDKEKEKRGKGQSAIGSWKTEAEMVLRQQYDS